MVLLSAASALPQKGDLAHFEAPLTVCQVLQDLDLYRGKIIAVRGDWHGISLEDSCKMKLKTGDYAWPNALYLRPTRGMDRRTGVEIWTIDRNTHDKAISELLRFSGPVTATIYGQLEAKEKLEVYTEGISRRIPLGFGPNGEFPAEIIETEIKDIVGTIDQIPLVKIEPLEDPIGQQ
jgi:hypothetical protein